MAYSRLTVKLAQDLLPFADIQKCVVDNEHVYQGTIHGKPYTNPRLNILTKQIINQLYEDSNVQTSTDS